MKFNKNLKKELKEIHIWDFPENMYIKLPDDYRNSFFRLAFLEFKTTANLKKALRENNLATNVIRWRTGKDSIMNQLVSLNSLLFITPYVIKRRNKILKVYNNINTKIDFSLKKIIKNKNLISLIKDIRYIFGGNEALSKFLDVNKKQSFTYTPDAGKGTAILGNTESAYDQIWHLPTIISGYISTTFIWINSCNRVYCIVAKIKKRLY